MLTFLIINLDSYRKYLILRINIYPLSSRILSQRTFYCDESKAIQMPPSLAWHSVGALSGVALYPCACLTDFMRADRAHQYFSQAEAGLPLPFGIARIRSPRGAE